MSSYFTVGVNTFWLLTKVKEIQFTCQWWNTERQKACPWVCVLRSVSNPKESIAGMKALTVYSGEPGTGASWVTWPLNETKNTEWLFVVIKTIWNPHFALTKGLRSKCQLPNLDTALILPLSTSVANSLYETRLREIMVAVFIKANLQSKMLKTTTMIHCRHISL